MLVLCVGCGRHIKAQSQACPFCCAEAGVRAQVVTRGRVSRAVMFAGAGTIAAVASCSAQALYGGCLPPDTTVAVEAACGFETITTTCTGQVSHLSATEITVGAITGSCSIDVTLGDGTEHTVPVTFGTVSSSACGNKTFSGVTSPSYVELNSVTCATLPQDSGVDAPVEAAADAAPEAAADAAADAGAD